MPRDDNPDEPAKAEIVIYRDGLIDVSLWTEEQKDRLAELIRQDGDISALLAEVAATR